MSPTIRHEPAPFTGPNLADVEKTMLVNRVFTKERKEIASGICGGTVTSWKRKEREDNEVEGNSIQTPGKGARKRREVCGKGNSEEEASGLLLEDHSTVLNSSGMAVAVEQPG